MTTALYLSYDGMTDPLGQSQVIPYLEGLAAAGHKIHLVSAEKSQAHARLKETIEERLAASGIVWHTISYRKSPPILSSLMDMREIGKLVRKIDREHDVEILHARSLFMAVLASRIKRKSQKIIFDMRGFWADERVDGGMWSLKNPLYQFIYRYLKKQELKLAGECEAVTVLTHAAKKEMRTWDIPASAAEAIAVIPTCADLDKFSPAKPDADRPFTFGYVGSLGTWYLFDETLQFFNRLAAHRPEARLLVVNRLEHDMIRQAAKKAGIDESRLEIVSANHDEVPALVSRMDAAGAIIRPTFSKIASAPTKLAEYLGCGVPCVGNTGVGDMEQILEGAQVGVALNDFSPDDMEQSAMRLLALVDDPNTASRCVSTAHELFSLKAGVRDYCAIYERLSDKVEINHGA